MTDQPHPLDHPKTLKLFVFCKQQNNEVGIREAQRALDVKSTSTVSWHFDKLVDSKLVEKLPNNRYILTKKGIDTNNFKLPVPLPVKFIRGQLIPDSYFLLSFSITSLILTVIFMLLSQKLGIAVALGSMITMFFLLVRNFMFLRQSLSS